MATTEGVLSVSSVDINVPGGDNTSSGTAETEPNETQQLFEQFMELKKAGNSEALSFLVERRFIVDIMYTEISSQLYGEKPESTVFQWIYECVTSSDEGLRKYALQFIPDLLTVYLLAVTDNISQVAALAEIALRGASELNKEVQPQVECPSLSKPSVYHEPRVLLPTLPLTESVLMRHDLNEKQPSHPNFKGKSIVASNRLSFLASVVNLCSLYLLDLSDKTRQEYCHFCARACVRGIHTLSHMEQTYKDDCITEDELKALMEQRRIRVDCELLTAMLQGIKKCIFHSCYNPAKQALAAIKFRAEYDQFPQATLISRALVRLSEGVNPLCTPPTPSLLTMFVGKNINLTTIQKYFNSAAIEGDRVNAFQRTSSKRIRIGHGTISTETDV
jgi:hypothetical protein